MVKRRKKSRKLAAALYYAHKKRILKLKDVIPVIPSSGFTSGFTSGFR